MPDSRDHYRTEARCLDDAGVAICFACCKKTPSPPFRYVDDDRPPPRLEEAVKRAAVMGSRPCLWLGDDGRCEHYDDRPEVCKKFEVGGVDCITFRTMDGKSPPRT